MMMMIALALAGPQTVEQDAPVAPVFEPWRMELIETGLPFPLQKIVRAYQRAMSGQVFKSGSASVTPKLVFVCAPGGGGGRGISTATASLGFQGVNVTAEVPDPAVVTAWVSYDGRQPVAVNAWVDARDRGMVQLDPFDPIALARSGQVNVFAVSLPIENAGTQRVEFDLSGWTEAKAKEMLAICPR